MAEKSKKYLEPWRRLDGKIVMVTGASSGLGRDFCLDLAKAGCKIIAAARRIDLLKSLCEEINGLSSSSSSLMDLKPISIRAVAVELDVRAQGTVINEVVLKAWDAFGRIGVLINNAGVRGGLSSSLDLSWEEWNNTQSINLRGAWQISKYVCKRMRDAGLKGSVINISSISGVNRGQFYGSVAYSTSKAGIDTLSKVMALELGAHKIRVNSIAPGLFKSEITDNLVKKEWLKNVEKRTVPLRTYGTSNPALTSLVRYLIHDSSEYVSGNIFIVDAGTTLPGLPIFSSL